MCLTCCCLPCACQGVFEDPTILFVGDVEIVEMRLMDDDPFIITQFHCQQLKCTRDKFGGWGVGERGGGVGGGMGGGRGTAAQVLHLVGGGPRHRGLGVLPSFVGGPGWLGGLGHGGCSMVPVPCEAGWRAVQARGYRGPMALVGTLHCCRGQTHQVHSCYRRGVGILLR